MTFSAVTQANPKTAEFAHLFDLFDRVATRRTRSLNRDTSGIVPTDDIAGVPAEFAPVLKNLSAVLSLRAACHEEYARRAKTVTTIDARNNNVIVADAPIDVARDRMQRAETKKPSEEAKEDTDRPAFPLGERYPFTFKLMLYKLYDLDEWAEKVRRTVETSRSQFKPLAEHAQNTVSPDPTANIQESVEKSSAHLVLSASIELKPSGTMRPCLTGTLSKPVTSRVLKKRCIGRRKSISGPMSSGVWVYDAAASATEVAGLRSAMEITLPARKDTRGVVGSRARHQSIIVWEEAQTRGVARYDGKIAGPLPKEKVALSMNPPSLSSAKPTQEVIGAERVVQGRQSIITTSASGPCKTATVKRPLCV